MCYSEGLVKVFDTLFLGLSFVYCPLPILQENVRPFPSSFYPCVGHLRIKGVFTVSGFLHPVVLLHLPESV